MTFKELLIELANIPEAEMSEEVVLEVEDGVDQGKAFVLNGCARGATGYANGKPAIMGSSSPS